MISKVQSKQLSREPILRMRPKLSAMEKGLLRWSMAEKDDKVLDLRVQNGLLLEYLHRNMECEICGMSDDMEAVRHTRSRLQSADIVYGSCEDIPWRENTFDSLYLQSAAHVTDEALCECLRVLKPGSQLMMGLTELPTPFRQLADWAHTASDGLESQSPIHRGALLQKLKEHGFLQITWQQLDLTNGVAIAWKPVDGLEAD